MLCKHEIRSIFEVKTSLGAPHIFLNHDRTDMILLTHYSCDFNCLLLLLNHTLLGEVFLYQNLTFIRLTLKTIYVLYAL
jgi:hypothetical protein